MDPREYVPVIRRALEENIAGFWYPRCLDREHGGYVIEFGRTGEVDGPVEKMIVTQARMVWLSARLARFRVSSAKNARGGGAWIPFPARAHVGLQARRVLLAVGPGGNKLRGDKHMYGQSFGVYALSEYAIASKLSEVRQFTLEVFDLLESKAHDGTYGGYRESFDENWRELDSSESGPMGPGRLKLMNTHLHLLEALTTFYRTTDLPRARERLMDLITIQSSSVVRKTLGGCTDKYDRDWSPRLENDWARLSYGHDIENVWLLMDACDAAALPNAPLLDLYRTLWAHTLEFGYDGRLGGLFNSGRFKQPADQRQKEWWVQAETLVSALRMWRMTRESK